MNALLIQNFDQFLDALNLCNTGIYTYQEVIESSEICIEDLDEFVTWNTDICSKVSVLRNGDFEVSICCFEPGQHITWASGNTWISVVSGILHSNGQNIKTGSQMALEKDQEILNAESNRAIAVFLQVF